MLSPCSSRSHKDNRPNQPISAINTFLSFLLYFSCENFFMETFQYENLKSVCSLLELKQTIVDTFNEVYLLLISNSRCEFYCTLLIQFFLIQAWEMPIPWSFEPQKMPVLFWKKKKLFSFAIGNLSECQNRPLNLWLTSQL